MQTQMCWAPCMSSSNQMDDKHFLGLQQVAPLHTGTSLLRLGKS